MASILDIFSTPDQSTANSETNNQFSWSDLGNELTGKLTQYFLDKTDFGQEVKTQAIQQQADTSILSLIKSPTTWIIGGIVLLLIFVGLKK